ncbi:hypothetical protein [Streptomyces sp. R33]|uniref:Zinc ribbon domain-containing protein n=1 Tax=Streptomyces sp. R33 TaxID=3238629 RepID=A0AB39Y0G8_9ACTN|nr:hypothetical protein VR46_32445 [Streptomyces sp. NRRL S-444]
MTTHAHGPRTHGPEAHGPRTHGPDAHGPEGPGDRGRVPAPPPAPAEGGEPACLLHLVCPDCGRLATERGARTCSRCGGPLPDPGP